MLKFVSGARVRGQARGPPPDDSGRMKDEMKDEKKDEMKASSHPSALHSSVFISPLQRRAAM
jgi:hypothetical protein